MSLSAMKADLLWITLVEAHAWEHDFLNSFYRYASPGNTAVCTHVFLHGTGELAN